MKHLFLFLTFVVTLSACKKPPTAASPATSSLKGSLVYRTTCQDGKWAPFPGDNHEGGPLLFLSDDAGTRVSMFAHPGLDGSFTIAGIVPGTYRLHLWAGNLHDFWLGMPINSFSVTVGQTAADVGRVCADATPIPSITIKGTWSGDESVLTSSNTLHVWKAAAAVTLNVTSTGTNSLTTVWSANTGELTTTEGGAQWRWPAGTSDAVLTATTTDNLGSYKVTQIPVRIHDRRIQTKPLNGFMPYADLVSSGAVRLVTSAPGVTWDTNSGDLRGTGQGADGVRAVFNGGFAVTQPVTFIVPMRILSLPVGGHVDLGFTGASSAVGDVRLIRMADHYELQLIEGMNVILTSTSMDTIFYNDNAQLYLRFDPSTLELLGGFGTLSPAYYVRARLSSWIPERAAPFVLAGGTNPADTSWFDVVFLGLWTDSATTLVSLPAAIGAYNGVTYDQTGCVDQGLVYFVAEGRYYPASGQVAMAIDRPQPFNRVLAQLNGCAVTGYVDMGQDEVAQLVDRIDRWDPEVMAPITGGKAYLY